MSKTRSKSLISQVMIRDLGLCCCCGFAADEVHHIIPLAMGGTDTIDNMITLCSEDHHHAPNTKEEFEEYVKHGGSKLDNIMGAVINDFYRYRDTKYKDLQKVIEVARSFIITLREIDINYCIEKYNKK